MKRTVLMYFSPTGTTKKVLQKIGGVSIEIDLTQNQPPPELIFDKEDFLIFGVPVYSGRVPEPVAERIVNIRADHTPAAIVATYGNRDYDDALLELKQLLEQKGFEVIAAAAVVTEHSIVPSIAKGRPDTEDWAAIQSFAKQLFEKAGHPGKKEITVKGNTPYREYNRVPVHPHANRKCKKCGYCAGQCPVGAIDKEEPQKTNTQKCISCMRCVQVCPQKARSLSRIEKFMAKKSISKKCKEHKQPEFFI